MEKAKEEPEEQLQMSYYLQKFRLYETRSKFYMFGTDDGGMFWRVLKIDRLEPNVLTFFEDPYAYTEAERLDLLNRINEGNRSTGGIRLVTKCYGIIGFVRFLGPYYIYVITKRRKIGAIGAHSIHAITKREMIPLQNSTVSTNIAYSKAEERYKSILYSMDVKKGFYFSYSYHVMQSLQKNIRASLTGNLLYEKMFVWNEFLTKGIRQHLNNTLWTVALVYGFFKQVKLSLSGREFELTLIARRSRHYAGTRYLKRGVNEKGRVANDVETEQIVVVDSPEGSPLLISSVVQHRGSIPLFWSQETSWMNVRPEIILSKKDKNYEATRLHFENLSERYGNPIIILNLIKTLERKPRESILRTEFAKAIEFINNDLSGESRLKFIHWDLQKHFRRNKNALAELGNLVSNALRLTGFFYGQVTPELTYLERNDDKDNVDSSEKGTLRPGDANGNEKVESPIFQNGVLRTNCIDCLDRTNVAQYSYGLSALGHQLHALGLIDIPKLDLNSPVADVLMELYKEMGDIIALQYGGSPAQNKLYNTSGQWNPKNRSIELLISLQRYYSNTYMDAEKQDAINLFLGHFQPQEGKPALWELDSDQHWNVGSTHELSFDTATITRSIKRSLSESNLLPESITPDVPNCETNLSDIRCTPSMDLNHIFEDQLYYSNFVEFDWMSSSGISFDSELSERPATPKSPDACPPKNEDESTIEEQTLTEAELPHGSGGITSIRGVADSVARAFWKCFDP